MQVQSLGQEDPLEEEILTPVFLPGESHGQRSLEGCLWDNKESDMMEQLSVHTHRMTLYCLFSKMFSFYGGNVHI